MELIWPHRRCILCKREESDSVPFDRAHVISRSVGGFLWAYTHCKECNSWAGHAIEAGLVTDESIQGSVASLASELPDLARDFAARRDYFARTPEGVVWARWRDGDFEVRPSPLDDGSVALRIEEARRAVEKRVRRAKGDDAEVAEALKRFDEAPVDVPFQIGEHTYTHRTVEDFAPTLTGKPVSAVYPSLVAFHFMAIALGRNAYDEQLDGLRSAIRAGEASSKWHVAESFIDRRYAAQHIVGFSQTEPYVIVRVQLFGWDVWRVHFPGVASASPPHGITLDLKTGLPHPAAPNRPTQIDRPPDRLAGLARHL